MKTKEQPHLLRFTLLITLIISGCAAKTNLSKQAENEGLSDTHKSVDMYVFPKRTNTKGYNVKFEL
jgi:hypothetical protein